MASPPVVRSAPAPAASVPLSGSGAAFALAAYAAWGVTPIYWKQLIAVDPTDVIAHRMVWSALFGVLLVLATGRAREILVLPGRAGLALIGSAALLAVNWWIFVWAVQHDRILDTSLGYYLNPLLNVGLGMLIFGERLSRAQWIAVAFACAAVAFLAWDLGSLPWVSLVLATTFAGYGVLRKWAPVSSITGFAFETCAMSLPALLFLIRQASRGEGPLHEPALYTSTILALLVGGSVVTAFPLLCFASAAKRLPLSVVGLFQYLAPSMALMIAVWLYDEPFTRAHAVSFGLIWTGLAIFSWDGFARGATERALARR